jgi:hypothetical protein
MGEAISGAAAGWELSVLRWALAAVADAENDDPLGGNFIADDVRRNVRQLSRAIASWPPPVRELS